MAEEYQNVSELVDHFDVQRKASRRTTSERKPLQDLTNTSDSIFISGKDEACEKNPGDCTVADKSNTVDETPTCNAGTEEPEAERRFLKESAITFTEMREKLNLGDEEQQHAAELLWEQLKVQGREDCPDTALQDGAAGDDSVRSRKSSRRLSFNRFTEIFTPQGSHSLSCPESPEKRQDMTSVADDASDGDGTKSAGTGSTSILAMRKLSFSSVADILTPKARTQHVECPPLPPKATGTEPHDLLSNSSGDASRCDSSTKSVTTRQLSFGFSNPFTPFVSKQLSDTPSAPVKEQDSESTPSANGDESTKSSRPVRHLSFRSFSDIFTPAANMRAVETPSSPVKRESSNPSIVHSNSSASIISSASFSRAVRRLSFGRSTSFSSSVAASEDSTAANEGLGACDAAEDCFNAASDEVAEPGIEGKDTDAAKSDATTVAEERFDNSESVTAEPDVPAHTVAADDEEEVMFSAGDADPQSSEKSSSAKSFFGNFGHRWRSSLWFRKR